MTSAFRSYHAARSPVSGAPPAPLLQRACAECRREKKLGIQTKLRVSQPGDRYEREADQMADRVLRMPDGPARSLAPLPGMGPARELPVARQADAMEQDEDDEQISADTLLSRKADAGAGADASASAGPQLEAMRGGGHPLDPGLRSFFEPRFGYDFGQVRVHTGARAAQSARTLHARAYTLGRNIAFAAGQYRPHDPSGRALIAHELAHVIQQRAETGTLMRACDCTTIPGATTPTAANKAKLRPHFPRLVDDDWCVIGPATDTYNCIAWSVGDTSQWIWNQVDGYGDNDGTVSISDFDAFYQAAEGLIPSDHPSSNTRVALFAKGTDPTHAARMNPASASCGAVPFTSKLGKYLRVSHDLYQLEGGPTYGDVVRYYDVP